jgi:hypothetical protein
MLLAVMQSLGHSVVEVNGALLTLNVVRPFVRVAPADVLAALVRVCTSLHYILYLYWSHGGVLCRACVLSCLSFPLY